MTNDMEDAKAVCAVVTAIVGSEATVGKDYGNWDGDRYVGFAAQVDDNVAKVRRISPAPTAFAASCDLLALVRLLYPDAAAAASRKKKCVDGMRLYTQFVEAKIDAAMAESAVRLADMRQPIVRGADLSRVMEAV